MLVKLVPHVRWMIRRDMCDIMDIENQSFQFPWAEEDFSRVLQQRNCIGMVAEMGGPEFPPQSGSDIVGYMIYELQRDRLHLLNFAVADDFRRREVGKTLVRKLTGKLSTQRRNRITLEIRDSNLEGQLFFKAMGFTAVGIMDNFYEDCAEDAYMMEYHHIVNNRIAHLL